MKKVVAIILSAMMALSASSALVACGGADGKDGKDGVNGVDGTNGIDGVNGVDGIDGEDGKDGENGKSAYEMYIAAHPEYAGDEAQWLADIASGKLAEKHTYSVVSYGKNYGGSVVSGTAASDKSTLTLDNCIVKLDEPIVMPATENGSWKINVGGVLSTKDGGVQLLTTSYNNELGRIFFAANAGKNIIYLGANIGGVYVNYCWNVPSATIKSSHEYTVKYENGIYGLSIDGGAFETFASVNHNQSNSVDITDVADVASRDFNDKVRAITGEEYFSLTSIGSSGFTCASKIDYLDVETSSIYGFENLSRHPLYGKTIYHLGSSISYGSANGGVSFAEQIANLTGSKCVKETVSGTKLSSTDGDNSYVARWENFTFADRPEFLVLQLSTNDFSGGISAGAIAANNDDIDTTTITGAIEHIIKKTKEKSPSTEVIVYTCAVRPSWYKRAEYASFVNVNLKMIKQKWGIAVVDLFNADTVYTNWMSDDIHPTGAGYANLFTPRMINVMTDLSKKG